MPRGDRTGPEGMGQRTGRGLGFCSGYQSAGFTRGQGVGFGFGNGGGRGPGRGRNFGMGRGFYRDDLPTARPIENTASLKDEARSLMDRLKGLLDAIDNSDKKE
jgi:hypothetical protein